MALFTALKKNYFKHFVETEIQKMRNTTFICMHTDYKMY